MALWLDIIDPETLTGYLRANLAEEEAARGTLARWLPNRHVNDIAVRFHVGQNGLTDEARYRAYDAEPEIGRRLGGKRVTIDLPALSQIIPVSEYEQLRRRNAPDESIEAEILKTTTQIVRAIADRSERQRGTVLVTGHATIAQDNYVDDADYQRDAAATIDADTATDYWSDVTEDRYAQLQAWSDVYTDLNGEPPGSLVMSTRVFRALIAGDQFRIQFIGGAERPASAGDVRNQLEAAGFPPIVIYDRKTSGGKVVPNNLCLLLPSPGPTADESGTALGSTFWGTTLTSMDSDYGIAPSEQPGIVAGVYRNEKPPLIAEVIADSITLPVLANANLAMVVKVLATAT